MSSPLPQICHKCRQFKMPELGEFFKRHGTEVFECSECLGKPAIKRSKDSGNESSPERKVRKSLLGCGFFVESEFHVGPFTYDFAIPKLNLLIELDSKRWHSLSSRKDRDRRKEEVAKEAGWDLKRFRASSNIGFKVLRYVYWRATSLGFHR
jgi:very-short-patch-repair endonuclease